MEVRIPNFHGHGAQEAKLAVFTHFSGYPRQFWRFEHGLDECSGTAFYRGTYLAAAWTGRRVAEPQFPLWAWFCAGRIKRYFPRFGSRLISKMKRISGHEENTNG